MLNKHDNAVLFSELQPLEIFSGGFLFETNGVKNATENNTCMCDGQIFANASKLYANIGGYK